MQKIVLFILFLVLLTSGCQKRSNQSLSNGVLFTIDNQPILSEEFIYLYEKNNFNNDSIYTKQDIDSYLQLFINFKLKVKAAYEEGIDTTKAFMKEFNTYKAELIKPYLLETQEADSLVKETYKRLQFFVHASHILIGVKDFSAPEDTLAAYLKIKDIRSKALSGEDFGNLAKNYSEDPSAKKNGGDLGFFSAMRMVYPFEDAAYKTPVGSISEIVKTQFGYHILKVHEKVPYKGRIKIAHLMVSNRDGDSANAKNKIFEIYDQVVAGGDWNYLVTQFSDDERTRANGGELGFISQGQLPVEFYEFEERAFLLENEEVSGPVESPYGWHILKLLEKQPPESFDELKGELSRKIAQGDRGAFKKDHIVERLKKEANFIENEKVLNHLLSFADSSLVAGRWRREIPDSVNRATLFLLNRQSVPAKTFVSYVISDQKRNHSTPEQYMRQLYNSFVEQKLYEYEEQQISAKHLDYRMLEKEYREGLLLFEVMEKNVWNRSMEDTSGMKQFYDTNKENYKWKRSAKATIASIGNKELSDKIKADLDRDKTLYFTSFLDVNNENLQNSRIPQLLKSYPDTEIVIEYNPNAVYSTQIEELTTQLAGKGIAKENIEVIEKKELKDKVLVTLTTRSKKALEEIYNKNSALTLQIEEGVFEEGEHKVLNQLNWETGIFELANGERHILVKVDSILPERIKPLSEIRGKVISDYQSQLESDWISELRSSNKVIVNEDVLKKIYKYFENK